MPLESEIPVKEVQRYMGYRGIADIGPDIRAKIDKAIGQVSLQSHPRIISKEYPVTVRDNDVTIHAGSEDVILQSESLARNLSGCCGAILLAATIGPACDMLVRRAGVTSAVDASIYQAAGAAAIESFLDDMNDRYKADYEAQGLFLRPRFSPGYGDLPLATQKDVMELLQCESKIVISLNDSLLMTPSKSVTAIFGIRDGSVNADGHDCSNCGLLSCKYRR